MLATAIRLYPRSSTAFLRVQCWDRSYTSSTRQIDVAELVEALGLGTHLYADDTQLYGHCSPSNSVEFASRVLIDSIHEWMSSNRLSLNTDKTQYIWLGTTHSLAKRDTDCLTSLLWKIVWPPDATESVASVFHANVAWDATLVLHFWGHTQCCVWECNTCCKSMDNYSSAICWINNKQ